MIDLHALQVLEFPKVLALIRDHALTPMGVEKVDQFAPMSDYEAIEQRQAEIQQLQDIYRFGKAFPLAQMEDTRTILAKTGVEGAFLDPEELLLVLELVEISIALHAYDREKRENFPEVAAYLQRVRSFPDLKKEINRTVDRDGTIKDSASPALKKIRADQADSKRRILRKLDAILSDKQKQSGWQDDVITQRNDRYVIPVVAGQYKSDQGILHDRSQSGATLYVEPQETVELNNRLNMLRQEEKAEIFRILKLLTAEISSRLSELTENLSIIGTLDSLYSAAKYGCTIEAVRPKIVPEPRLDLRDARHPLLVTQFGKKEKVVPLSLALDSDSKCLLVTGPNTGGKTIALKATGLLTVMALTGMPIPADEKSTVGVFHQVFADIGDEQSIELSLSTFSSHVRNISRAVSKADPQTLVLLDEVGAGTDPKEGAALAEVLILHLVELGALMIASTHYSQLKTLALEYSQIQNASLQFDRKTLAPTYVLQMGIPGSSYAVEIARRLGIPEQLCDRASQILGEGERSLSDLIASLETELTQVKEDRKRLTERLAKAEQLEEYYTTRTEAFEAEIEKSRTEALAETEQLLKGSRKEIERLVAAIRSKQASRDTVKQAHTFLKDSESKIDELKSRASSTKTEDVTPDEFHEGDRVRIISLNQEGEIQEILGEDKARVQVGSINTVVPIRDLSVLAQPKQPEIRPRASTPDAGDMSPEIHLRGMTVEEALESLERFLDRAVIAGLGQIYVIHGKGTGTLRRVLTDFLRKHREVDSLRLGNWNEGGAGVTIVKLKS